MEPQTWSIVVLCYNEAANIARVIQGVTATLSVISPRAHEIVVVDDGSSDDSVRIVRELAAGRDDLRLVEHGVNKGVGEALQSGYAAVRMENVCAVPGDGQFDFDELLPFARLPPDTFVSFTRRNNTEYSAYRRALTRTNRQVNRWFLGAVLEDANWVKAYKVEALRKIPLEMRSSLIQSEIPAKLILLGYKMVEPDSKYLPRAGGKALGASPKMVLRAARETWKLMRVVRRFAHARARGREHP